MKIFINCKGKFENDLGIFGNYFNCKIRNTKRQNTFVSVKFYILYIKIYILYDTYIYMYIFRNKIRNIYIKLSKCRSIIFLRTHRSKTRKRNRYIKHFSNRFHPSSSKAVSLWKFTGQYNQEIRQVIFTPLPILQFQFPTLIPSLVADHVLRPSFSSVPHLKGIQQRFYYSFL